MGIRTSYDNGVFSWVDLMTTDPEAAKTFYSELFSWSFVDMPVEGMPPYSMAFKHDGLKDRRVAALFEMPSEKIGAMPPHWQSYINVTDIEKSIKSCEEHGGKILNPICDILDSGRMAVVMDPTNAVVNLWEPKSHIGAELVNEVNTYCWAELQTRGAHRAVEFYQAVFGWGIEIDEKPPQYVIGLVNGRYNCGIFDMDKVNLPINIPSQWAAYFNVENLDESIEKVRALGGKTMTDPIEIDPGRFATIMDPQGAVLTMMQVNQPDD